MKKETIYLAGGCFWGTEKYISLIPGVLSTEVGYINGKRETVTYEQVCREDTGHAETVRVEFDAERLPLFELLTLFFDAIDPLSVNRQGNDVGTQYRTGIYYADAAQKSAIDAALSALAARFERPRAIEALPLLNYCRAEEYHQKYLEKNPSGYCHIGLADFVRLAAKVKRLQ